MPYRICKTIEIESGHMLSKSPDKCRFPHGHTRKIELIVESDALDKNDMVCDFSLLKIVLKDIVDSFDHAMCINTNDPMYNAFKETYGDSVIGFANADPTAECMAKIIFDKTQDFLNRHADRKDLPYPLAKNVRLRRVRLWETSTGWAEYVE